MKVTTELKNLIKNEFETRRKRVIQEYEKYRKQKYQDALNEIGSDELFIQLKETANKLCDKYLGRYVTQRKRAAKTTVKDVCYITDTFEKLIDLSPEKLYGDNTYFYNICNDNDREEKIKELNKQEQSLLIKLTYEKDIEVVKEMLKSYNIEIL